MRGHLTTPTHGLNDIYRQFGSIDNFLTCSDNDLMKNMIMVTTLVYGTKSTVSVRITRSLHYSYVYI